MKKATVLPLGATPEGVVHGAVRHEDRTVSLGVFRPLREGQPVLDPGGVCQLADQPGTPFLEATFPFAEEPAAEPEPAPATGHKGPARVSSAQYHAAWERIFGGPRGEA